MVSLEVCLLGGLKLEDGGEAIEVGPVRAQELLAYLLLNRQVPPSRAQLAYLLWPDSSESQARTNLRQALYRLRQALPQADRFVDFSGRVLQWREDIKLSLDVERFEAALAEAAQAEEEGEAHRARQALECAVSLYRGDLLPELYQSWLEAERERLRQGVMQALDKLVTLLERDNEPRQAIAYLQRLLQLDPLLEKSYRSLMRLYALTGERGKAVGTYHRCVSVLEEELGLEPSAETQEVYKHVLKTGSQAASPAPPRALPVRSAPPFVGREAELKRLWAAWQEAKAGQPSLVLLCGESGIGKTRLASSFARRVRADGQLVMSASCYAAEGDMAYAPLGTLLKEEAVRGALQRLEPVWLAEVSRLLPELLATHPQLPAPSPLSEGWQRQRFFEALARAVLGRRPRLLILDDLQWCDRDSLEWLHYLLRYDASARVLVVATARLPEMNANAALTALVTGLRREGKLHELELPPFSELEANRLAQGLAPQLNETLLHKLYRHTEGNPLFVVETLREDAMLTSLANGSPLPPKLQAVIASRFERASAPAQELLRLAAVIGRDFSFDLLVAVNGGLEEDTMQNLDELWQQRVVREQSAGRYDFSHDKLREVAYAQLSQTRRQRLHRQVAEALEGLHAEDLDAISGQIAAHYHQAGKVEQAIHYYRRAADAARRLYANEEATHHYERALGLLAALGPSLQREVAAQLLEGLGDVYKLTRNLEGASACYDQAIAQLPENRLWLARLRRKLGLSRLAQYLYDDAIASFREGEKTLGPEPAEDAGEEAAAWWQEWLETQLAWTSVFYWQQTWQEMDERLKRIEPVIAVRGAPLQRSRFYSGVNRMMVLRDRFVIGERSLEFTTKALQAALEDGDSSEIARSRFNYGFDLLWFGAFAEAEREFLTSLALTEQIGDRSLQARCLTYLSVLHRKRRDPKKTAAYAHKSLALTRAVDMPEYIGVARGHFAWLAWLKGDLAAAEAEGVAALEAWETALQSYPIHWPARLPLLAVALERERYEEALSHGRVLLEPKQQRLPEALTGALEQAVTAKDEPEPLREALARVVEAAKEACLL